MKIAGRGGSSYIDSVVLRDRDMNGGGGWTGASDGTLEARHYYAQNWRADVSAIFDNAGDVVEWHKYSAYGIPFLLTPGDHDKNGDVDKDDSDAFNADYTAGNLRADLNKDGVLTTADQTIFNNSYAAAVKGGRWKLSSEDVGNRKGYAGYEHEGFGNDLAAPELAHVRHRVLHFGLGRWTKRDPLGYVDGMSLVQYAGGFPVVATDPDGRLIVQVCCVACAAFMLIDLVKSIYDGSCASAGSWEDIAWCLLSQALPVDVAMCILRAMDDNWGFNNKINAIAACFQGSFIDIGIDILKLATCACCMITTIHKFLPNLPRLIRPAQPALGSTLVTGSVAGCRRDESTVGNDGGSSCVTSAQQ
jgi:RHS repeat-associated protein